MTLVSRIISIFTVIVATFHTIVAMPLGAERQAFSDPSTRTTNMHSSSDIFNIQRDDYNESPFGPLAFLSIRNRSPFSVWLECSGRFVYSWEGQTRHGLRRIHTLLSHVGDEANLIAEFPQNGGAYCRFEIEGKGDQLIDQYAKVYESGLLSETEVRKDGIYHAGKRIRGFNDVATPEKTLERWLDKWAPNS